MSQQISLSMASSIQPPQKFPYFFFWSGSRDFLQRLILSAVLRFLFCYLLHFRFSLLFNSLAGGENELRPNTLTIISGPLDHLYFVTVRRTPGTPKGRLTDLVQNESWLSSCRTLELLTDIFSIPQEVEKWFSSVRKSLSPTCTYSAHQSQC